MSNESTTPVDAGLRRNAAPEAISIANLGLVFTELGKTCGALARRIDATAGPERTGLLAGLARELRESGDLQHETARLFEDASLGRVRPADPGVERKPETLIARLRAWFKKGNKHGR